MGVKTGTFRNLGQTMDVVIDSTEFFNDYRVRGTSFEFLAKYLADTSSSLFIPRIVFEETVNHFKEHLTSHVNNSKRELFNVRRILDSTQKILEFEVDIEKSTEEYQQYLKTRIEELNGTVIEYDKITLSDIVQRSLQRQKPFDREGRKGFRDAIIWETILKNILSNIKNDIQIALISNNSNDFGKDDTLDDELVAELERLDKEPNIIKLFNGMKSFVDKEIKPTLNKLDDIKNQLKKKHFYKKFDLTDFFLNSQAEIQEELRILVSQYNSENLFSSTTGNFHSPVFHSSEPQYSDCHVGEVWSMENQKIAMVLIFDVIGNIECIEKKVENYPSGDEVFDLEYEEQYSGNVTFKIVATIFINSETGETELSEFNGVFIDLGPEWPRQIEPQRQLDVEIEF